MAISEQFSKIGDGLLVRAPGKINLSLLVAGKRPDGYHELETIMAKIDWYDEILIEKVARDPCLVTRSSGVTEGLNIEHPTHHGGQALNAEHRTNEKPVIELICKGPYEVPAGEDNLVYKAAKLILDCGLRIADFNNAGKMPATRKDNADEEYAGGDRIGVGKQ